MPDLPPIVASNLARLQAEIYNLRMGGSKKSPKPHKLLMLLSVIDLAEQGLLNQNRIYFNQQLVSLFEKNFRHLAGYEDWCQPGPPFFHLRSSDFWNHQIIEGREHAYGKLNTSGGGTKRILDNIEFAFLSDYAFFVFEEPVARQQLKQFIIQQIDEYADFSTDKETNMPSRIGTMFHESFALSRPSVSAILAVIATEEIVGGLSKTLREKTLLGTNYVKAMPRYARGCGLLTNDNQLTTFGKYALENDSLLINPSTQWLMHYYMSAPHGPGPAIWQEFVRHFFRYRKEFTKNDLAEHLLEFIQQTEDKSLSPNSATSTANCFVGTYEKDDGLGRLNLLESDGDTYHVLEPELPPLWTFAVALLDYCQYQYPGQMTVNLANLYQEGGLTSIFMMGEGRLNRYLHDLQRESLVDVYRVAPPYQLVLVNPDPAIALAKLYTVDEHDEYNYY